MQKTIQSAIVSGLGSGGVRRSLLSGASLAAIGLSLAAMTPALGGDLGGAAFNYQFPSSMADPNQPYTNTGVPAPLNLSTATSSVVGTEPAGAIGGPNPITLNFSGPGTLELQGDNSYSGGTNLSAGTLRIDTSGALGSGPVQITGAATLEGNGAALSVGNVVFVQAGVSATLGATSGNTLGLTGGLLAGGGGGTTLHIGSATDTGTVSLVAGASAGGNLAIDGGTLQIGGAGGAIVSQFTGVAVGTVATSATLDVNSTPTSLANLTGTSAGVITNNGAAATTLFTNNTFNSTFGGVIQDGTSGPLGLGLNVAGSGGAALTLTGANTYTGGTTINAAGTLALALGGSIANSSGVTDNGTFDIQFNGATTAITSLSGSGSVTLGANTLTLSNAVPGANGTFGGAIGGTGGLTLTAGTETLGGANTYTGATTINGGTLALLGTGSIATSSAVNLATGGAFDISQTAGATITTLGNTAAGQTGTVFLGGQTLQISNGSSTFGGVIADGGIGGGTGGNLAIVGGTETLSGVNTYTGATFINGGATLALSGTGLIATSSGVTDNGTFDISATTAGATITTLSGAGAVALGGQTLILSNASSAFGGVIADGGIAGGAGGNLAIAGGTETLSGVNTYTGATFINGGATLALSGTGSIAASSGVADNGTFDISATTAGATIKSLFGAGTGVVTLGAQTLTLSNAGGAFGGVIGGAGGLTLTAGTETLGGANTYTGATTINGGTLALLGTGSIATSSAVNLATGGAFDISQTAGATITTLGNTAAGQTGTVFLGGQTLQISNGSSTFGGVIADGGIGGGTGGNLAIVGGTETLSGVNTYTGATFINGGATLALQGIGSIAMSSGVVDNGTFDISASNAPGATITTLSGTGGVTLGANTLTLSDAAPGANGTFGGAISGAGGLTLLAGTETLAGANTYTGTTNVNGGTLDVNGNIGSGALPTGAVNILAGANLNIGGSIDSNSLVSNAGALTVNAGGKLIAHDLDNLSSGTVTNNGTIIDDLNNAGTVTNNAIYNANVASNTGTITNSATGAWTGNAINTTGTIENDGVWTGNFTTNGGTLTNTNRINGSVTANGGIVNSYQSGSVISQDVTLTEVRSCCRIRVGDDRRQRKHQRRQQRFLCGRSLAHRARPASHRERQRERPCNDPGQSEHGGDQLHQHRRFNRQWLRSPHWRVDQPCEPRLGEPCPNLHKRFAAFDADGAIASRRRQRDRVLPIYAAEQRSDRSVPEAWRGLRPREPGDFDHHGPQFVVLPERAGVPRSADQSDAEPALRRHLVARRRRRDHDGRRRQRRKFPVLGRHQIDQ